MKKKMQFLFSLLLVLLLVSQSFGASALAAGGITGEELLIYKLYTSVPAEEDGGAEPSAPPVVTQVTAEQEAQLLDGNSCSVKYGEQDILRGGGIQLKDITEHPESSLEIAPPEGFYVSRLYLCGKELTPEQQPRDLLKYAEIDLSTDKISIPGTCFITEAEDGSAAFNEELLSSSAEEDSPYTLYIQVEKRPAPEESAQFTVTYAAGDAPVELTLPEAEKPDGSGSVTVQTLQEEQLTAAKAAYHPFTGWLLQYKDGPSALVQPQANIRPYADLTLTAQWGNEVHASVAVESAAMTYGDPVPTPSLKVDSVGLQVDTASAVYTYQLGEDPVNPKDRLAAGEYTVSVSGLQVTTEEGGPYEGPIETVPGKLTVEKRPVTVTANAPVAGSGGSYTANGYDISGLADGDTAEVSLSEPILSDGKLVVTPSNAVIKNGGQDVTANYSVSYQPGSVEAPAPAAPTAITVKAKDRTAVYNGAVITAESFEITAGALAQGDYIAGITYTGGSVNVSSGVSSTPSDLLIKNAAGEDVTAQYSITTLPGTVTVTARPLTVAVKDASKAYDGQPFTPGPSNLDITGRVNTDSVRHEVRVSFQTMKDGKRTAAIQPGTYTIDLTAATVVDASGTDVTSNYSITLKDGTLTISGTAASPSPSPSPSPTPTPSPSPSPTPSASPKPSQAPAAGSLKLTVTAESGSWVYDGTEHEVETCSAAGLRPGDRILSVSYADGSNSITDAGTQESTIRSVSIVDSNNASANYLYSITYVPGTLTVAPAPLTLTAESDSKTYDGTELENKNVSRTELASSDHSLSVRFDVVDQEGHSTKAIEPGTYTKEITGYTIMDGNKDVSANYAVKCVNGTLTVRPSAGGEVQEPQDQSKGGGGLLVVFLLSALVLGGLVAGYFVIGARRRKAAGPETEAEKPRDGLASFKEFFKRK